MRVLPIELANLSPVVVVDDDEFFRVAIETLLQDRFGVENIVVCGSAPDAMHHLSDGTRFGLGLVDLNMPGTENRSLLDAVRAAQPDIRLVVLSASKSRDDILMALSAGAHGFIQKGLGIAEMEKALRHIAGGAVYVPPFMTQTEGGTAAAALAADNATASLQALTPRQQDVLRLLVAGQPNKGIARTLNITQSTVKFHLSVIYRVLGASNRVEAATAGSRLLNSEK